MNHVNKIFLIGFSESHNLSSFFKDKKLKYPSGDSPVLGPVVDKAIASRLPPLFFLEPSSVLQGDWIVKYLKVLRKHYPDSKFILNLPKENNRPEKWRLNLKVLKDFFNDENLIEEFLLSGLVRKYEICANIDINIFSSEDFMAFDPDIHSTQDLIDFISKTVSDKPLA